MVKRDGACIYNSNTAYCFGGGDGKFLHQSQRSKLYFIHDTNLKTITPVCKSTALDFANEHGFSLIRKRNVRMSIALPYDCYNDLAKAFDNNSDKMKGFIIESTVKELSKLPSS